jgi:hypothetical protein
MENIKDYYWDMLIIINIYNKNWLIERIITMNVYKLIMINFKNSFLIP